VRRALRRGRCVRAAGGARLENHKRAVHALQRAVLKARLDEVVPSRSISPNLRHDAPAALGKAAWAVGAGAGGADGWSSGWRCSRRPSQAATLSSHRAARRDRGHEAINRPRLFGCSSGLRRVRAGCLGGAARRAVASGPNSRRQATRPGREKPEGTTGLLRTQHLRWADSGPTTLRGPAWDGSSRLGSPPTDRHESKWFFLHPHPWVSGEASLTLKAPSRGSVELNFSSSKGEERLLSLVRPCPRPCPLAARRLRDDDGAAKHDAESRWRAVRNFESRHGEELVLLGRATAFRPVQLHERAALVCCGWDIPRVPRVRRAAEGARAGQGSRRRGLIFPTARRSKCN
jgi:hypothetical protein